jgi:aerobic C4-dicarboxylate transport protein
MAFAIGKYRIGYPDQLVQPDPYVLRYSHRLCYGCAGVAAALVGLNILKLLSYIKWELLIVLGTTSSEAVLPQLMRKLEHLSCPRSVVGLTVPAGYSVNLDGTSIY